MEIAESIYKLVVEPSYRKYNWKDSNCAGHSRQKRGETTLSHTHAAMIKNAGKRRKRYVGFPEGK